MAITLSNKYLSLQRWLDVSAFLRWWVQGLLLWLPVSWRQRLTLSSPQLLVLASESQLQLYDKRGAERRELMTYERKQLTPDTRPDRLPKAGDRQVVLGLTPEQVLCTTVTFPLAAENNLHQVVGFEIDRLTPFSSDKVYYDAKIVDRQPDNRILRARLAVVPRTTLTAILAQLQTLGLTPAAVVIEGDTTGLNLLPPGKRRRRLNAIQWWGRALLLLIALTLLVAAALPLWQQRSIVVRLLPLVAAAEQEAQSVLAFRDRLDNAIESSQFLLEKRRQSALMVDVLNELTALLPDNTYIEQLSLRNGQLELRGQSTEATALIGLIEDSRLFAQTTFRSPVVKDNRTGQDRFVISATVTPVPEHAPSAHREQPTEDLPEDLSEESPDEQSEAEPSPEPVPTTESAPSPESGRPMQNSEQADVN